MKKDRRDAAPLTAAEAPVVTDERFALVQSDPRFKRFPKVRLVCLEVPSAARCWCRTGERRRRHTSSSTH